MARKTDTFLSRKQVDLGPTEKGGAAKHGYRRRLTENVLFKWKAGDVVGVSGTTPATCVFSLPQASLTMTTKVLVQLTHVVPAAGGYEPKIYTHKTQKEIEKHVAREGKRFEKMAEAGDESAGTFFVDGKKHPPQGVVAFAILPLTKFADGRDGGASICSKAPRGASRWYVSCGVSQTPASAFPNTRLTLFFYWSRVPGQGNVRGGARVGSRRVRCLARFEEPQTDSVRSCV
tara:strand:- start:523 stop:1218 length:696 start_codon:yes stop_codon:yes gene_type:complete